MWIPSMYETKKVAALKTIGKKQAKVDEIKERVNRVKDEFDDVKESIKEVSNQAKDIVDAAKGKKRRGRPKKK